MTTQQDLMKKLMMEGSPKRPASQAERRGSRRCKITQLMRIRPSNPEKDPFVDIRSTASVSRSGLYFHTSEQIYQVGMRLFVTMPYAQDISSMSRDYLAEVVRRDVLPTGMFGIGIKILMEMSSQPGYSFVPSTLRK